MGAGTGTDCDARPTKHTAAMGKGFGELAHVRGIIKYSLSPFEQRAFAGAISFGVPNMFRRFRGQVLRVAPPFIIGYMIYSTIEARHQQMMRMMSRLIFIAGCKSNRNKY